MQLLQIDDINTKIYQKITYVVAEKRRTSFLRNETSHRWIKVLYIPINHFAHKVLPLISLTNAH